MALGVGAAFPLARVALVKRPQEVGTEQLRGVRSVLLVDSVVSMGRSAMWFVRWLRGLKAGLRVVVVCGVAHRGAVEEGGSIERAQATC